MSVRMTFAIARGEAIALEAEARKKLGPRFTRLDYDEDGDYELVLILDDVDDVDAGRWRGTGIWNELIDNALLPPREPTIIGVSRYSMNDKPERRFVDAAYQFLDEHQYEMAVVAAHIGCEVVARTLIEQLDVARAERLPVRLRAFGRPRWSVSSDPGLQFLFHAATGVRVEDFALWDDYRLHVKRRNKIVHEGAVVTLDEAQASIAAADAFIEHLQQTSNPHVPAAFRSRPPV